MQRYWLFLLIGLILSLLAGRVGAAPPVSDPYVQLKKMDTEARTAWVDTMLKRLDEANHVVLAPEAVAKQHARFEKMLAAFVKDRADWRLQVTRFESELALSQRAAMEHLVRRYRMDAYRAFRGDRVAFQKRRELLERLLSDWRKSTSPSKQRHKVVQWLITATREPAGPNLVQLPPLPKFKSNGSVSSTNRAIAILEPDLISPAPSATKLMVPSTLPEVELPPSTSPRPRSSVLPHDLRPATLLASRIAGSVDLLAARPVAFYTPPSVELPIAVHRSTPRPHHVAMRPSFEPSGFAATLRPAAVTNSSRPSWRRPSSVASVTRPTSRPQPLVSSRSASSPSRSRDPLAFARTKVDRLTMVSTRGGSSSTSMMGGLHTMRTGQANLTSMTFAQEDEPDDSVLPPARSPRTETPLPNPPLDTKPTPNMDELAARIRGNNMALRKLAAQLYEERGWDAKSLNEILNQLEPLVARKDDLKLIRELIPPKERERVGELETGSDLISGLGSKIARARSQIEKSQQGNTVARERELEQLDKLSKKLANLVFSE